MIKRLIDVFLFLPLFTVFGLNFGLKDFVQTTGKIENGFSNQTEKNNDETEFEYQDIVNLHGWIVRGKLKWEK